ncbi:MAG: hypothetical protein LQ341_000642 [Variospora aurantia]|nr:MAG: hypothetical protein LQ341_000642 [Variospora aurantia]
MLTFLLPVLVIIAAIRSAAAAPTPGAATPPQSLCGTTRRTVASPMVDPCFDIHLARRGGLTLETDSALMAMTKVMHHLSGYDFDNEIGAATYLCKGYADVSVTIKGVPGRTDISVKYAIWGAFLVGHSITWWKAVRNHVFALEYDGRVVGYIELEWTPVQLKLAGSSGDDDDDPDRAQDPMDAILSAQAGPAAVSQDPSNVTLAAPFGDDSKMILRYQEVTTIDFTKWEFFANIYLELLYVASFPPRWPVQTMWAVSPPDFPKTYIGFIPKPPYLAEFRHVALASLNTANRILTQHVAHGLIITISLEEESIGESVISRGEFPPE